MKSIWHNNKLFLYIVIFLLALLLAGGQSRILILLFKQNIGENIEAAKGVLQGFPHWKIYQSRILGPYLIDAWSRITGLTFDQSFVSLSQIWLFLFFFLIMLISYDLRKSLIAIFASGFGSFALTVLLIQGKWLYPWDLIDLIIFSLLIWTLVKKRPVVLITAILFLEILNRNVVIILAAWLVWDSLFILERAKGRGIPKPRFHLQKAPFYSGLAILFIGVILIHFLENQLLIREIGPEIFPDVLVRGDRCIIQLSVNIRQFQISLTKIVWVYNILIFGILFISLWGIWSFPPAINRICFLHFILWLFTVIFGLIYETRVWLCFIPFLILIFPIMLSYYEKGATAMNSHFTDDAVQR